MCQGWASSAANAPSAAFSASASIMTTTPPNASPADQPLRGYEVVVCVCGGIAAYKSAALVSKLVQAGAGVSAALTRSGRRFVGAATFRGLTGRPVLTTMWHNVGTSDMDHLRPSETADLIIVAPATANIIGKLAGGIADDLVSTLLLAADCPVLMAPAMNDRMWLHPAVQRNADFLRTHGVLFVGPDEGWLACGTRGPGRMSAPEQIFAAVQAQLLRQPPQA